MSETSLNSPTAETTSTAASTSTLIPEIGAKYLFNGVVAGINLRSAAGGASIRIEKSQSVSKILNMGPKAILGMINFNFDGSIFQLTELMERIDDERCARLVAEDRDANGSPKSGGILRDDVWKHAFHGRHSAGVHSRFMRPLCARYSSAEPNDAESDDIHAKNYNFDVVALHLPYLHWDKYNSWKSRQRHILKLKELDKIKQQCQCLQSVKDVSDARSHKNELLLHEQLHLLRPMHDRRTLDQSYFYNLRKVAYRDDDQVIGQHTLRYESEQRDKERKMMMVDQLWMWVIDEDTIVTSFPETSAGDNNGADVLRKILSELKPSLGQRVKSLNSLVALIIDTCTDVFHRSDINPDLAFFEFFADEIGTAKSEVEDMYTSFYVTSQSIEKLWTDPKVSTASMTVELDSLFSIQDELKLLQRVEAIISDLHKIDFLCSQQTDVLYILSKSTNRTSRSLTDLYETTQHRRRMWSDMAESAQATQLSLQGLFDLKQRQAAVSEARTVRYQVELSAKQGRSIMLLTVVTIVFLPVSVTAAIFGMNAMELNAGELHLSTEIMIMAPVTLGVILVALGMAFKEAMIDMVFFVFHNIRL